MAESSRTLSVNASATAEAIADQIKLSLAIEINADSPQKAQNALDEKIQALLSVLESFQIKSKDVKTTLAILRPKEAGLGSVKNSSSKPEFLARKDMRILIRDPSSYDSLIPRVLAQGVNRIENLEFVSSREVELADEALKNAIEEAKRKAALMSKQLGVSLGKVLAVSDSQQLTDPGFRTFSTASATSLAPGLLEVRRQVSVQFEIN